MTLVEVLASLTLFSLVITTAFMLFFSVNSLWGQSVQKFDYDSNVKNLLDVIQRELSESTEIYFENGNTIRYLKYRDSTQYSFTHLGSNFRMNSDGNEFVLADNVQLFTVTLPDGMPVGTGDISSTPLLKLSFTFVKEDQSTDTVDVTIRPFN